MGNMLRSPTSARLRAAGAHTRPGSSTPDEQQKTTRGQQQGSDGIHPQHTPRKSVFEDTIAAPTNSQNIYKIPSVNKATRSTTQSAPPPPTRVTRNKSQEITHKLRVTCINLTKCPQKWPHWLKFSVRTEGHRNSRNRICFAQCGPIAREKIPSTQKK